MNFGIDLTQPSTHRGIARATVFIVGLIMSATGKGDITMLLLLGSGVNGLIGVAVKDKAE
jgi:hypothetical protein